MIQIQRICKIFIIAFIYSYKSLPLPGLNNPFYPIKSYYGSREKEFYTRGAILNDDMTTFLWFGNINKDSSDNIWVADPQNHIISYMKSTTGRKITVAGSTQRSGFRNGDLSNSRFNAPSSLVLYQFNQTAATLEKNKIIFILDKTSENCTNPQYLTYQNYTTCQRISTNESEIIDPSNIMIIYPPYNILQPYQSNLLGNLVFIADTGNSCIRLLNLTSGLSSTYAGKCTQPGFKDGPLGVNQFNKPKSIGIDVLGNLYVVDHNNYNYMRMINSTGYVSTLLKGSCRVLPNSQPYSINQISISYVTCYRNWIKTSGIPSNHIWSPASELDECFKQEVLCNNSTASPLIYLNSTFQNNNSQQLCKHNLK